MTILASWLNRYSASPSKEIRLGDRRITVNHLGDSDPYSHSIHDDYGLDLQRFCRENLTGESVVFDVGANIGLTACVLSQHAKLVHAFEPNPSVFPLLQKNIGVNQIANVSVHPLAIGAEPGTTHFSGTSAFGFMTKDEAEPAVSVETVDRLVAQLGLQRLDLLKIDVEGFEPDVLAGARETISKFKPTIYMELNAWCIMHNARRNPCDFAEMLARDFGEVLVMRADGRAETAPDPTNLVYQNLFNYGSVNDLVLKDPRF